MKRVSSCTLPRPGGHHLTVGVGDFVSCIHDVEGSPPYLCRVLDITKEESTGIFMGIFQWLYRRDDIPKKKLPNDLAPNEVFLSNHIDGDNPMESILDLCRVEFERKGQKRFVAPMYGNKLMPEGDEEAFYCNKMYNPNTQKFTSISKQDFANLQTNEHLLPSSESAPPSPPKKPKQKQSAEKPAELPIQIYSEEEEEYEPSRVPTPPLFNSPSPIMSAIPIHSPSQTPQPLTLSLPPKKPKNARVKVTWADDAADIIHEPIERVAMPSANPASPQQASRLEKPTTTMSTTSTTQPALVFEQRPPMPRLGALHLAMNGKRARFQPPVSGLGVRTLNPYIFRHTGMPTQPISHGVALAENTSSKAVQQQQAESKPATITANAELPQISLQPATETLDTVAKDKAALLPPLKGTTELSLPSMAVQAQYDVVKDKIPLAAAGSVPNKAIPPVASKAPTEIPQSVLEPSVRAASPEQVPSSSQDTPTKRTKRLKSMRMNTVVVPPSKPEVITEEEEKKRINLGGNKIGPEHQADIPAFTPKHLCPAASAGDLVLYSPTCLDRTERGTVKPPPKAFKEGDIFGIDIVDTAPNRNKFDKRRMMWCRIIKVAESYVQGVPVDSAWPSDANDPKSFRASERFAYSCARTSVFVGEHEREQAFYRLSGQPFSNSLLFEPSLDFVCKGVDSAWQSWTWSEFFEYCEGMRVMGSRDAGYCDSEAQFLRVAERIKTKTTADVVDLFFAPKRNLSNHPLMCLSCLHCGENEGLIVCQKYSECKEAICKKCIKRHPGTSKREERQLGGTVFEQDRNSFFLCEQCSKGPTSASLAVAAPKRSYAKRRRMVIEEEQEEKPPPAPIEEPKETANKKKRPSASRAATAEPGVVGRPKAPDEPKSAPKVVTVQQQPPPELPAAAATQKQPPKLAPAAAASQQQPPKLVPSVASQQQPPTLASAAAASQQQPPKIDTPKTPLPARALHAKPRLFPEPLTPPKPAFAASVAHSENDGFADDGMSAMQLILHPKTKSILESVERGEMDSAAALVQLKLLLMSQAQAWLAL